MFGFGKKRELDWPLIAGNISKILWVTLNEDFQKLAQPYARFVVGKNSSVQFYNDVRDPKYILGWGDLEWVALRENEQALSRWVDELKKAAGSPDFQLIATEEFAKVLVSALMSKVEEAG